jgi:tetratricopeptide (TPR) repeat protein
MKRIGLMLILSFFLLLGSYWSSAQTAKILLLKAFQLEEEKGELEKAIKLYKIIVEKYRDNRQVAAMAQLHIGICYEKLGKQAAKKAYRKVIREFADQEEVVAEARIRLSEIMVNDIRKKVLSLPKLIRKPARY